MGAFDLSSPGSPVSDPPRVCVMGLIGGPVILRYLSGLSHGRLTFQLTKDMPSGVNPTWTGKTPT